MAVRSAQACISILIAFTLSSCWRPSEDDSRRTNRELSHALRKEASPATPTPAPAEQKAGLCLALERDARTDRDFLQVFKACKVAVEENPGDQALQEAFERAKARLIDGFARSLVAQGTAQYRARPDREVEESQGVARKLVEESENQ